MATRNFWSWSRSSAGTLATTSSSRTAQVLGRSPKPPNRARISSKLGLRIDDAELHAVQPATV
jgi:hypothetical protein